MTDAQKQKEFARIAKEKEIKRLAAIINERISFTHVMKWPRKK